MHQNKVIERIKAGREEELNKVYATYRKEFLTWITRTYGCNPEDGKDIFQATLIAFYESIINGKLTELKSSIKTYLFAIGKNKYMEFMRFQERDTDFKNNFANEDFKDQEDDSKEIKLKYVEVSMNQLGDPCKSILQLYYYHKLSVSEITERLHYKNSDTLKNLKYKCIKRLKKIYDQQIETQNRYE